MESDWYNRPVAIEFFTLASNRMAYDSLYKRGETQTYYALMDQYGIYQSLMVPVLDSLDVMIVDSIPLKHFVIFGDSTSNYIVNIDRYRSDDGVLMFTPGKAPVYWQEKNLNRNCIESTFLHCYFDR